jgi:hypothetical protein
MDVVVHAFSVEMRERYQLDNLWKLAREVNIERELKTLSNPDAPVLSST